MLPSPRDARAPKVLALDGEDLADRAERLITGDVAFVGFPWSRVRVIDTSTMAAPFGIELRNNSFPVDLRNASVGLTWDNAQVLQLGEQRMAPGDVVPVTIGEKKGRLLEVWSNDGDVTGAVVAVAELNRREEQRQKDAARGDRPDADNPLAFLQDLVNGTTLATLAVVAVVGVVLWQVAKNWNGAIPAPAMKL